MKWLKWFVAGTLAVPLFHQVVLFLLNMIGLTTRQAFAMTPTAPFGVPSTLSLSFWGGVWGVILGVVLLRASGLAYWIIACVFGAIAPTLVAIFVVIPLRGTPMSGGPMLLLVGLLINLAWGWGTAALYRVMEQP
jgi:hypothetical protein